MTPALLAALTANQRRLVRQSIATRHVLDEWFNSRTLAEVGVAASGGSTHRRGRLRIITEPDPKAAKNWSVAQHVYAARSRKGWTQQELSDRCGIARANIARVEAGRHVTQIATLRRIAAALDVSLAWLLETPGKPTEAPESVEGDIDSWARELERLDREDGR